jgi:hypothetical protein
MKKKLTLACALALVAAGLTALTGAITTSSAQAELTGCAPGFTLTSGGASETDYNFDGLTCEVTTSTDTLDTTIAVDNTVAPDPPTACPDNFTPGSWPPGYPPDRNMNGIVCHKFTSSRALRAADIVIDDHVAKPKK